MVNRTIDETDLFNEFIVDLHGVLDAGKKELGIRRILDHDPVNVPEASLPLVGVEFIEGIPKRTSQELFDWRLRAYVIYYHGIFDERFNKRELRRATAAMVAFILKRPELLGAVQNTMVLDAGNYIFPLA